MHLINVSLLISKSLFLEPTPSMALVMDLPPSRGEVGGVVQLGGEWIQILSSYCRYTCMPGCICVLFTHYLFTHINAYLPRKACIHLYIECNYFSACSQVIKKCIERTSDFAFPNNFYCSTFKSHNAPKNRNCTLLRGHRFGPVFSRLNQLFNHNEIAVFRRLIRLSCVLYSGPKGWPQIFVRPRN
jgi:hypothetical protein